MSAFFSCTSLISFDEQDIVPTSNNNLNTMSNTSCSSNSMDICLLTISSSDSMENLIQNDQPQQNNNNQLSVIRRPKSFQQNRAVTSSHRVPSFYENTDETYCEFLTASQIQTIMNVHQREEFNKSYCDRNSSVTQINSNVFGCNINQLEIQNGGLVLPPFIENSLIYLLRYGVDCVGIFRKSGVRSRIQSMKSRLQQVHGSSCSNITQKEQAGAFNPSEEEYCVYDLADLIKSWLRELRPQKLIGRQVITLFIELKRSGQLHKLMYSLVAHISDAQRDLLHILLNFLSHFARNSHVNQMNAHNLAICFAPSLCEYSSLIMCGAGENNSYENHAQTLASSLFDPQKNIPVDPQQTSPRISKNDKFKVHQFGQNEAETLVNAQHCLEYLIDNYDSLCMVSPTRWTVENTSSETFNFSHLQTNTSFKLLNEGNLLPPACEANLTIPATPKEILNRLLYQRNVFDPTIIEWKIIECNEDRCEDVFEFKAQKSFFLPSKTFRVKRSWTFCDLPLEETENIRKLSTFYTSMDSGLSSAGGVSNSPPVEKEPLNGMGAQMREEANLYHITYTIRPMAESSSLLCASVAVDLKGRSFYWYKNVFPSIMLCQLHKLRQTFVLERSSNIEY